MTYTIQVLRIRWYQGNYEKYWEWLDSFEDKALAEKELTNLNRQWPASGTFRLTSPD